jgi:5,5'-dehydrodivanillate O-demethylase
VLQVLTYVRYCNFFQNVENAVDEAHVAITHQRSRFSEYGLNFDIPKIHAEETDYGLLQTGTRANGGVRVNHFIMPNLVQIKGSPHDPESGWRDTLAWRVPIDDAQHRNVIVSLTHVTGEAAERYRERQRTRYAAVAALRSPNAVAADILAGNMRPDEIEDRFDIVNIQDHVVQEAQGVIADRAQEHLGRTDVAILLLRQIWARELRALAEGRPLKQWTRPADLLATVGA